MRRSPRARRSSYQLQTSLLPTAAAATSWARCSLHRMVALLYTLPICSMFTCCFTTEVEQPRASDLLRRRTSKAPATEQLRTPPNTVGQTGAYLGRQTETEMCCECETAAYPLPPRRERRRRMKRETSRKHSAQDRINMNRFWNEMEEFYSRQQEEKTEEWRCDWEVEQAMMVVSLVDPGRREEEEDRISCYSSASSSFSGSISSTPSSPNKLFSPLDMTSEVPSLPMPPSIPQTRALLTLVERMQTSRISTAV